MLPKGTRDILPLEKKKRDFIKNILSEIFEAFGYQPIETPALELFKTLSGKYGEEGERLMFKLMPRGAKFDELGGLSSSEISSRIEEALRYDLTVPFARFVVDHRSELSFPFKRYQMQSVWRADRPQKGRYREFTQCDADVAGTAGSVQEAELLQIYDRAFEKLGLPVVIRINHRGLLQGLAEQAGCGDRFVEFAMGLDKLDKVGWDGVRSDWAQRDLQVDWTRISWMPEVKGDWAEALGEYSSRMQAVDGSPARRGIDDLRELEAWLFAAPLKHAKLELDPTLARGLDYYTGCIFEVSVIDLELGSVGGGGRYDDLTGLFGLPGLGGVGISFGLDRIALAMEQRSAYPSHIDPRPSLMLADLGGAAAKRAFALVSDWRSKGRSVEFFPKNDKIKKQMEYAERSGIQCIGLLGEEELQNGTLAVKNLQTGEQRLFEQSHEALIFEFAQGSPSETL
jgi:histidyl-tRNA synthetase